MQGLTGADYPPRETPPARVLQQRALEMERQRAGRMAGLSTPGQRALCPVPEGGPGPRQQNQDWGTSVESDSNPVQTGFRTAQTL